MYAKTEHDYNVNDEVTFLIRSQYFKARHKRREDKTNSIVGTVKRAKFMGAWLRIEIEAPHKQNYLPPILESSSQINVKDNTKKIPLKKLIKIEVPTTKVAIHNFVEGQIATIFFPSEYVIVFPKIDLATLETTLRVN